MMTNDGENWSRGSMIGQGCGGSVYLAVSRKGKECNLPAKMAAKCANVSNSDSIRHEAKVLFSIQGCSSIIQPLAEEVTTNETGEKFYNLLLEFADEGSLSDLIKTYEGRGLPEADVRRLTRSIVQGISHVHRSGYVHRDMKPENILLVSNPASDHSGIVAKIADFGLARKTSEAYTKWRGTVMYLPPEALIRNEQDQPSDIWSVGCIVLEMLTGKSPWDLTQCSTGNDFIKLMLKRGPNIPARISPLAKDFLKCCLARQTWERSTAESLLSHPFLSQPHPSKFDSIRSSLARGVRCFRPSADHHTARLGMARIHPAASGFGISRMQAGR